MGSRGKKRIFDFFHLAPINALRLATRGSGRTEAGPDRMAPG